MVLDTCVSAWNTITRLSSGCSLIHPCPTACKRKVQFYQSDLFLSPRRSESLYTLPKLATHTASYTLAVTPVGIVTVNLKSARDAEH